MNTGPEIAVWVLTPGGLKLAEKLSVHLGGCSFFVSENLGRVSSGMTGFKKLAPCVFENFRNFKGHIFIMATGIVVRVIADVIRHKTGDPAVVVVDDAGMFAISLISGHLGGANELARSVSEITGGIPVITTATDVNHLPSIDVIAQKKKLIIENPANIKIINMAFLKNRKVFLDDPYGFIQGEIPESHLAKNYSCDMDTPIIKISDTVSNVSEKTLLLRPPILSVGIGCNRGTPSEEIQEFFFEVCKKEKISVSSIKKIASIDIKKDESGILEFAEKLGIPTVFFNSDTLNQIETIKNPSIYAEKYTGARSVCEAAAIQAANRGELIIPKKKTKNVTVAIAREKIISTSLV